MNLYSIKQKFGFVTFFSLVCFQIWIALMTEDYLC
jgi:hypothetical protein